MTAWFEAWRWLSPAWPVAAALVALRMHLARRRGAETALGACPTGSKRVMHAPSRSARSAKASLNPPIRLRFRGADPSENFTHLTIRLPLDRPLGPRIIFGVGVAAFLLAMVSPVAVLADGTLFCAHMAQHLILLLIAPLCWTLGLPRTATRTLFDGGRADRVGCALAALPVGWLLAMGAMWFWHAPVACDWSVKSGWVAAGKCASLTVAGTVFWWPIFSPVRRYRARPELAVVHLFTACLGCTLLGVFLTFTNRVACPVFAAPVDPLHVLPGLEARGLTSDVDQRLGGLMMWVPTCMVYLGAISAVMVRWYRVEKEPPYERSPQH